MFEASLKAFLADAQRRFADGLTLGEAGQLFVSFLWLAVDLANDLRNPGPEKKAIVLQWVGVAFDTFVPLIPTPIWYRTLIAPFVRPHLRSLILGLAGGMIEFRVQQNKV
jgi:hypothetical protein